MGDGQQFMRCSECKELFAAHFAARVEQVRTSSSNLDIILCPVCRLKAVQRGITITPEKES